MKLCPPVRTWVFLVAALASAALVASLPCSPDLQVSWVVNNSATASELARASNCSGGVFDVLWVGHVEIPETIYIVDDTAMNITGAGAGAVADGANRTQFLNVVNAALRVSGLRIQNCISELGGAIYSDASKLSFTDTTWSHNTADVDGGAIYVHNSSHVSHVSWSGETTWSYNTAGRHGGAVVVGESSYVSWSGESMWSYNMATEYGGAILVYNSSHVSWSGEMTWSYNTGDYAGAVFVWDSFDVSWSGETTWSHNTANSSGGAGYVWYSSNVSWSSDSTWSYNNAGLEGGAITVWGSSDVSWGEETTWSNNAAGDFGGAVLVYDSSDVSWISDSTWSYNNASEGGGAILVYNSSHVSWSGEMTWSYNTGAFAGAVLVWDSFDVSWSGDSTWSSNSAYRGGAVYIDESSGVSWSGDSTWSSNSAEISGGAVYIEETSGVSWIGGSTWSSNSAAGDGGAVVIAWYSNVSWSGDSTWSNNTAGRFGGAVDISASDVSWSGDSTWSSNSADEGGGAVHIERVSVVSWSGDSTWFNNRADNKGGAVQLWDSMVSWSGDSTWSSNIAYDHGGAVNIDGVLGVSWSGDSTWSSNRAAVRGGAMYIDESSDVSWSGDSTWFNNSAQDGGAVEIYESLNVSWIGGSTWFNNSAHDGGAVRIDEGSNVSWIGGSTWFSNRATVRGGAVYIDESSDVSWIGGSTWFNNSAAQDGGAVNLQGSSDVSWSGETTWSNNSAGIDGGAIYASLSTLQWFDPSLFEGNTANGAGGALVLSGVDAGPEFVQTNFTANNSPRGGAVYSVSSGIATDENGESLFPVVYKDCFFTGNRASSTGGAIESVAGNDHAVSTVFEGNTAGVGGALRLGGSAFLTNCTFVDNAAEDEGPAISNLGVLELEGNSSLFSGNVFSCEVGTYLDSVVGNRYLTVCDGCPGNNSDWVISVENEDKVPICVAQLEHTRSEGEDTTIETLVLDAGYWRATNDSVNVLACYNEDACAGGMTDDPAFCQPGYKGPYCSVCTEGFSKSLAFTCTKCVDDHGGIAIMVVVGLFVLCAAIALCIHLVSGETEGGRRGVIHRIVAHLPFQSIKIVVVVWQILTQFSAVANVTYPDVYQRFLDGVNILNFDVLWIPSAGCLVEVGFHGRLLVSTIGPLVALALLAITYTVAKRRSSGSEAALQKIRHKHVSIVLLITFLVYSSVSATVFQSFACEDLDDRKNYLRADYRIECDSSEHQAFQVFAGIMILVYPVGIPLFYGYLLYINRRLLKSEDEDKRETSPQVQPISDLWAPYKSGRFYYEVIECVRRMSLTGVVVFIYPNTAAQVAVTLIIAFSFVVVSERLAPYASKWDASISLTGHIIVFTSMYTALLSKVDVSDERANSQEVFAGILVAAHACMVVAVIVEAVVMFSSVRRNEGPFYTNNPRPRVYCKGSVPALENAVLS